MTHHPIHSHRSTDVGSTLERMYRVCRSIAASYHVVFLGERVHDSMSVIEKELHQSLSRQHENINKNSFSKRVEAQLDQFIERLSEDDAYSSELALYYPRIR